MPYTSSFQKRCPQEMVEDRLRLRSAMMMTPPPSAPPRNDDDECDEEESKKKRSSSLHGTRRRPDEGSKAGATRRSQLEELPEPAIRRRKHDGGDDEEEVSGEEPRPTMTTFRLWVFGKKPRPPTTITKGFLEDLGDDDAKGDDITVVTKDSTEASSSVVEDDDDAENDDDGGIGGDDHMCPRVERMMNGYLDAMEECVRDSFLGDFLFVGEIVSRGIEDVVTRCEGEHSSTAPAMEKDPSETKAALSETHVEMENAIEMTISH